MGRVNYVLGWPVLSREVDLCFPLAAVEEFVLESVDGSVAIVKKRRWVRTWEASLTGKDQIMPGMDVGQRFSQSRMLLTFRAWVKLALEFTIVEKFIYVKGMSFVVNPIIDPQGRHCGVVFVAEEEPIPALMNGFFAFVLISVTERYQPLLCGPSGEALGLFDENRFSQHDGIANTLLIDLSRAVAKRVAVVQIHYRCWLENNPQLMTVRVE